MRIKVLTAFLLALLAVVARPADAHRKHHQATIEQLLELDVKPFAIAHRGFGENLGEDPSRPIENTVAAVREGFAAGVSVVEVDVQLTRDGEVAVYHDDFLADLTCLNQLTFRELQHRLPFVPRLESVLREARKSEQESGPLRGLLIIELKAAAPLCDPDDTQDPEIVAAVSRVVRRLGMTDQVMFASFSPALLYLASMHAPEITRDLSISGLQFLTAPEIEAILGYAPIVIEKRHGLGLQWAEIGPIFRLPGYRSVDEVFATAFAVRARAVEADLFFLQSAGTAFVDALRAIGLTSIGFTATSEAEWFFLQSLGLDGVYTNDVLFGVENQAPIP